jgi:hypothetical protein
LVFLPKLEQQLPPADCAVVAFHRCLDLCWSAGNWLTHAVNIIAAKYEFEIDTVTIS